jgi:hypothetical protein
VPIDTGAGVSPTVFDLDVESGPALLYGVGRENRLHCGGGYILFDWAPFSRNLLLAERVLPTDISLATLGWRYYSRENYMSGSIMSIGAMDALAHHCVVVMIVRVYGSLVTQRINGGQLRVMGRALVGEHLA